MKIDQLIREDTATTQVQPPQYYDELYATLTSQQIQQLFAAAEQAADAREQQLSNKTGLGKTASALGKGASMLKKAGTAVAQGAQTAYQKANAAYQQRQTQQPQPQQNVEPTLEEETLDEGIIDNLLKNTTAEKLTSAWKKAGQPNTAIELYDFLVNKISPTLTGDAFKLAGPQFQNIYNTVSKVRNTQAQSASATATQQNIPQQKIPQQNTQQTQRAQTQQTQRAQTQQTQQPPPARKQVADALVGLASSLESGEDIQSIVTDIEALIKDMKDNPNEYVEEGNGQTTNEDLRAWFGKGKKGGAGGGGWDRYNTKGERIGKCGEKKPGEGKPKCLSKEKAASLRSSGGKKAIGAAVSKKRREDPNPNREGGAKMVSNKTKTEESLQYFVENFECPYCHGPMFSENQLTEEAKKDACYHKVKSRYKVWPSAYASGALVKCRKAGASNWGNKSKKTNEEVELDESLKNKLAAAGVAATMALSPAHARVTDGGQSFAQQTAQQSSQHQSVKIPKQIPSKSYLQNVASGKSRSLMDPDTAKELLKKYYK